MLVLANGAFKSGSSWLLDIIEAMGDFEQTPPDYRFPYQNHPWLDIEKVEPFMASGLPAQRDYISKAHIMSEKTRDLLLSYDEVRVFNITRNLGDALVSHFYHLIYQGKLDEAYAKDKLDEGFRKYYWRLGRYKAQQILTYHTVWSVDSPAVYVSSFERLKTNFADEVRAIGEFLGYDLSESDIQRIKEETSLNRMQAKHGEDQKEEHKRFRRKGKMGEWKTHFDAEMLRDLESIQRDGLGTFDQLRYHAVFKLLKVRRRVVDIIKHKPWRSASRA